MQYSEKELKNDPKIKPSVSKSNQNWFLRFLLNFLNWDESSDIREWVDLLDAEISASNLEGRASKLETLVSISSTLDWV